jgi:hypothetical protein
MTFLEAIKAIADRLVTNFTTLTVYDDPNVTRENPPAAGYVGMHIGFGSEDQIASGGGAQAQFLTAGVVDLEIYSPKNAGDGLAWSVVDEISALFRTWYDVDIEFTRLRPEDVGWTEDEQYYQVNLHLFFDLDSHHNLNPTFEAPIPMDRVYGRHTRVAHGYSVGQVLDKDFAPAIATAETTLGQVIVTRICTADVIEWTKLGRARFPAHGLGAAGTQLCLSASTPGLMVATTAPATPNTWAQGLGYVYDAESLLFAAAPGQRN